MKTIKRKRGAFNNLVFEVDLTDYGKTASDIEDVFFSVKNTEKDDDDCLLLKKLSLGKISVQGTTYLTVYVAWDYNEYANFQTNKEYIAGLFLKFTGDSVADENVDQTFKLFIEQDFLKTN